MAAPKLPRIYFLDGAPGEASARYRVFHALEQLKLAGVEAILLPRDYNPDQVFSTGSTQPGVLVVHRAPWDERLAALLESARAHHVRPIYDIDDLVFEPIAMPWVRALSRLTDDERAAYEDDVRSFRRALKACDAVLTTTRSLASYAAAEGLPAFVHRNGFGQRSVEAARAARKARRERDETVLYYGAGTGTHDVDFQACAPALERLLRKHDSVRLMAQGDVKLGRRLDAFGGRVVRWPWMPWPDYFRGIAEGDINLAPLEPGNPFCEVKSELKWFEAALLGIPTVASPSDAFCEAIQPGANGFLAASFNEWFEVLDQLVRDAELRRSVGARAESDVLSRYDPSQMGSDLVELLARIASSDDLDVLARSMTERGAAPAPPAIQTRTPTPAIVAASNGKAGAYHDLALDVSCRKEDGVLGKLGAEDEIAQTFKCDGPNLTAIAVKASMPRRAKDPPLKLSLYSNGSGMPTRANKSAVSAKNHGWLVFRFKPIAASAGKRYRFALSSSADRMDRSFSLSYARESLYRDGTLSANGKPVDGALVFQTFLERRDADKMRELIKPEQASIVEDLLTTIAERETEIAAKDAEIGERDQLLAGKDQLLAEKGQQIAERDRLLADRDAAIAAGEAALADRDRQIQALHDQLEAIRQSRGYKLLNAYRAAVQKVRPPAKPRRRKG